MRTLPFLLLTGCGLGSSVGPPSTAAVVSRTDLSGFAPEPVGVTVDPDGDVFVIDAARGIFRLDGTRVASRNMLSPGWDVGPFTDVAALGEGRFAVTVRSDGLLYDGVTTRQFFCYEPGDTGWDWSWQLTHALAWEAATETLYAQPLTYDGEGVVQGSNVAEFDGDSGADRAWYALEPMSFEARGLAVEERGLLLLGRNSTLLRYRVGAAEPEPLANLGARGVARIEGLALRGGNLLVVDGADAELVELADWR